MKRQSKFKQELSQKYNLPLPVIEVICNSPFSFAKEKIKQDANRPIMFAYLGKIKLKKKFLNESTHI